MSANHNPPAFARPASKAVDNWDYPEQDGMTLRDYFAAKALAGSIAGYRQGQMEPNLSEFAKGCFAIADAMLAARSKKATS